MGVPKQHCLRCNELLDVATVLLSEDKTIGPKENDFTICLYCGHVMAFNKDLSLRELTGKEMLDCAGDTRIMAGKWARDKTMEGHRKNKKRN